MSLIIRLGTPADEAACNALAKRSPYTRDFANPPLSLKAMRKVAFTEGQVYVATMDGAVVGFLWSRPMKPARMNFSTVYYVGVSEKARRQSIATLLFNKALPKAKGRVIELTCEDANVEAAAFYSKYAFRGATFRPVRIGTVGKDARPYTRWRLDYEPE